MNGPEVDTDDRDESIAEAAAIILTRNGRSGPISGRSCDRVTRVTARFLPLVHLSELTLTDGCQPPETTEHKFSLNIRGATGAPGFNMDRQIDSMGYA